MYFFDLSFQTLNKVFLFFNQVNLIVLGIRFLDLIVRENGTYFDHYREIPFGP